MSEWRKPSELFRVVHRGHKTHSIGLYIDALDGDGNQRSLSITMRPVEARYLARQLLKALGQRPEMKRVERRVLRALESPPSGRGET